MSKNNKEAMERYERMHAAVRDAVVRQWDLGMYPADEFDAYFPVLCGMLMSRKPVEEVSEFVEKLGTQITGLDQDAATRKATAAFAQQLCDMAATIVAEDRN